MLEAGAFGQIIEANAGFLHSSDLDPQKPINWKRTLQYNGEYGCLGDLGPHACTVPLRAGWIPRNVRAVLSNIMRERPAGRPDAQRPSGPDAQRPSGPDAQRPSGPGAAPRTRGSLVPCETWDNATLLCEAEDPASGSLFPLTLRTARIAPGEKNNWYVEIYGTRTSARYSLKNANVLELLEYTPGGEQAWRRIDMGHEMTYKSVTAEIFQAGVCDVLLQMWAAFLYELESGETPARFAGCVTPAESMTWHKLFTAALESQAAGTTVPVAEREA
jgi:predicted dehydrogenase